MGPIVAITSQCYGNAIASRVSLRRQIKRTALMARLFLRIVPLAHGLFSLIFVGAAIDIFQALDVVFT